MRMPGSRRVLAPFRRDRKRRVDDELRSHIEMKARELEEQGMPRIQAERAARRSFGDLNSISDECRRLQAQLDGRRARWELVEGVRQDLRAAVRTARRNPGFVGVAVTTLAIGIGANTAVFSVLNGLLLRPLPGIDAPEGLVEITQGDGDDFASVSYPVFKNVRDRSRTLRDVAAFDVVSLTFGGDGTPEVYFGLQVTGNYFSVLGVEAALGRFFAPERSFFPDIEDAVVISNGLWERRFARRRDILGRTVLLNGYPARIIGVTPEGFGGHVVAAKADLFVPVGMQAPEMHRAEALRSSDSSMLELVGRLAPGSSMGAAADEVSALANAFIRSEKGPEATYPLQTAPYAAVPGSLRSGAEAFFAILTAIVSMLLVITCMNVANMMLSRAGARRREIAVRLSLGASRTRLIRQLLTESLLVSAVAAAAGTVVALWLTGLLAAFQPPVAPFPGMRLELDFGFDARVLGYGVGITCLTTLLFGLVPALRATRPDPVSALKDPVAAGGSRKSRLRAALVAGQMATTILLLVGSGLLLRALRSAQRVDTGFDAQQVQVASFDLELNGYDDVRTEIFYRRLLDDASGIPGVVTAAVAGKLPLAGASTTTITVPGDTDEDASHGFNLHNQSVSAAYFQALGLPLLRGSSFRPSDTADARMVAVVNETMAERFWSVDEAIGKSFIMFGEVPVEVIGVVADAKYHRLDEQAPLFAYFSYLQRPRTDMYLHLKTDSGIDTALLWARVREISGRIDPAVPILSESGLSEALSIFILPQRVAAWVTGVVGALGLLLGAVGIYGVTAYSASRRAHEIGVRIALGAGARDVRRMMMRQGMAAPIVGMVLGLLGAAAVTRLLGAFLFSVSPLDPITFVAVSSLLFAVALLATAVPARRAARVNPVVTLKAD